MAVVWVAALWKGVIRGILIMSIIIHHVKFHEKGGST